MNAQKALREVQRYLFASLENNEYTKYCGDHALSMHAQKNRRSIKYETHV